MTAVVAVCHDDLGASRRRVRNFVNGPSSFAGLHGSRDADAVLDLAATDVVQLHGISLGTVIDLLAEILVHLCLAILTSVLQIFPLCLALDFSTSLLCLVGLADIHGWSFRLRLELALPLAVSRSPLV